MIVFRLVWTDCFEYFDRGKNECMKEIKNENPFIKSINVITE